MRIREYITALWADWMVLMSGSASVALAFWAAYFPPTNIQAGRTLLWIAAVACFIIASYRIWARERDAREKEIAQLKTSHQSEITEKDNAHKAEQGELIEGHVKAELSQIKLRETEVEAVKKFFMDDSERKERISEETKKRNDALIADLRDKITKQANQIYELTKCLLTFELDVPRSKVSVNGNVDEFNVILHLYVCFHNSDTNTRTVRSVNVLLMKMNEEDTASAITPTDQKFYTILIENDNPVTRFWENRNISIKPGEFTLYHTVQGHISVSGDYREILNKDCFLRVTMQATSQELCHLDFDVKWQDINLGWIDITPRT